MTIQDVITKEKQINDLVIMGKNNEAFEEFYGEDVVMTETDGS